MSLEEMRMEELKTAIMNREDDLDAMGDLMEAIVAVWQRDTRYHDWLHEAYGKAQCYIVSLSEAQSRLETELLYYEAKTEKEG